jgi:2-keto-4-pentenoate hydratase/2-oxohepta-3-ene-1,7-dioic acid hydratase in catechol pathway
VTAPTEPLRLATIDDGAGARPVLLTSAGVVELPGAPRRPDGLLRIIEEWTAWEPAAREAAAQRSSPVPTSAVRVLPPLLYPGKLLLAGSNYGKHAGEMRAREQRNDGGIQEPYLFALPTRHVIVGDGADVVVPAWAHDIDWEVELAVVIGRTARDLAPDEALDAVFGYTILNDVTSRAATKRSDGPFRHDWFSGKGLDTFCPMGPCIVPATDLHAPFALRLTVNGEVMQDGTSDDMVFGIAELVSYCSQRVTLDAGDVISTGTPSGVGAGRGRFLQAGDAIVASIEGIGALQNRVVAKTAKTSSTRTP